MKRLSLFVLLAFAIGPVRADDSVKLIEVRKIWDKAPHNAFTDLVRFQDRWFCVFREGKAHVSPDGALRFSLRRTAKMGIGRPHDLAEFRPARREDHRHSRRPADAVRRRGAPRQIEAYNSRWRWFSKDGRTWSEHHEIGDPDFWLWRVTWHKGMAYSLGYGCAKDE